MKHQAEVHPLTAQLSPDGKRILAASSDKTTRLWDIQIGQLAGPATRTISPLSTVTVPQYIENRIREGTADSLAKAEHLLGGNTDLLVQRITALRKSVVEATGTNGFVAWFLANLGKLEGAESFARASLAFHEAVTNEDWAASFNDSLYGGFFLEQQQFAATENLLLSGYEGLHKAHVSSTNMARLGGSVNPEISLKGTLRRLVELYEATGQPAKAAEWKQKLEGLAGPEAERKLEAKRTKVDGSDGPPNSP